MNNLVQHSEKDRLRDVVDCVNETIDILRNIGEEKLSTELEKYFVHDSGNRDSLLEASFYFMFAGEYERAKKLQEAYCMDRIAQGDCDSRIGGIASMAWAYFLTSMRETKRKNEKRLYIMELDNKTIKIGVSNDVKVRISQIKHSSGATVLRCIFSEYDSQKAYKAEATLHRYFAKNRLNGEFFNVSFDEAVDVLERLALVKELAYLGVA